MERKPVSPELREAVFGLGAAAARMRPTCVTTVMTHEAEAKLYADALEMERHILTIIEQTAPKESIPLLRSRAQ